MSDLTVSSIPIINVVIFFIIYLVIHVIIGLQEKKYKQELRLPEDSKECKKLIQNNVDSFDKDSLSKYKFFSFMMMWFPAFYIIFIIIILYGF